MVALRYQVDSRARRAKLGNSFASIVAVGADERAQRQLVEHDVDDRHRRLPPGLRRPPARSGAPACGPARRRGTGAARRAGRPRARSANERTPATRAYSAAPPAPISSATGTRAPSRRAGRRPAAARTPRPAGRRTRASPTDPETAQRPHDQRADQRRHERVAEREDQDVAGRAPARDEELRVVPQQVEQRLANASAHRPPRCRAARQKPIRGVPRRSSGSRISPLFARR